MSCDREDVIKIAKDLHMRPSEEDIQYVIENFDAEADADPTGDWTLWIENLLSSHLDLPQFPPPKKYRYFLYDITTGDIEMDLGMKTELEAELYDGDSLRTIKEEDHVIQCVIAEMRKDLDAGDVTAIDELLRFLPLDRLKGYLPEEL